jgi:hypothetical protein
MTSPYVPALPTSKGRERSLSDNWRVFPYHDQSILNLRFIDQVVKRPVIDKVIHRSDYPTNGDFETRLEDLVFRMNDDGYNCYQLLNLPKENFVGDSVCDSDIEMVEKIFIDVDRAKSVRATANGNFKEAQSPASQKELDESRRVLDSINGWLSIRGWPDPYIVQSGNGYHAYYSTDGDAIEADPANSFLRKTFLRALAHEFNNSHSQVDQGVYNNARITKIIGSMARKGQCSEDRPYRRVELISSPEICNCIFNDHLRSAIEELCPELLKSLIRSLDRPQGYPSTPETPRAVCRLQHALSFISADCPYDQWLIVLWSILSTGWRCAQEIAYDWSASAPHRFNEDEFLFKCDEFDPEHPSQLSVGTVFYLAKAGGWRG